MRELATTKPGLRLVAPNVDRDAPFAMTWLEGDAGKQTLLLMGNPESKISAPSPDQEHKRIEKFLTLAKENKQLTWMMRFGGKTIGAVWVDLQPTNHLPPPAIHIVVGDPSERGGGIGKAAVTAVIDYLKAKTNRTKLYSRYLTSNTGSIKLLSGFGFEHLGPAYLDEDGLEFQNVVLSLQF